MYTVILLIAVYLGGGPSEVRTDVVKKFVQPGACETMKAEMEQAPKADQFKFECKIFQDWVA